MDYRKDYYQILEVGSTASKEDIRAAYRRLAKLYHPDKNPGDATAEEKFKLINEANEILSSDILRNEYDNYRAEQEKWKKQQEQKAGDNIRSFNKKTYTRVKTVTTETRIYIRGKITVKYWADCKENAAPGCETELDYKINSTEAIVTISEQNIFPSMSIPVDYLKAFKESDIFTMPIPQPIRCEVISETGKEYFELSLNDIRIKNIRLDGVTKHENNSYGTLTGDLYAYTPKFTYEEVEEEVTECFGETGQTETKQEGGFNFIRKQFYHPDCSTYWGNWVLLPKVETYKPSSRPVKRTPSFVASTDPGCGILSLIFGFLLMLIWAPKFFIFCLILGGVALLLNYGDRIFSSVARIFSFVGVALLLLFLITAVRSISHPDNSYIKQRTSPVSSVKTTKGVRESTNSGDSSARSSDTLITHFIKWEDQVGNAYEGNLSISVSALRNANAFHRVMGNMFYQNINDVYKAMLDHDSSALYYVYETFDSIRAANTLDDVAFGRMVVSAIQSQPYFLVLDKGCDDNYSDDFIRNYLANCNADCCVGNELFGVRSPIEFLSDLKGDCDTRSLILYQILKHYNYDVALLTSNYYKHAMIAISFPEHVNQPGANIIIGNKKYYMWETTSSGVDYGEVSPNFNNLSMWDISLISKK